MDKKYTHMINVMTKYGDELQILSEKYTQKLRY